MDFLIMKKIIIGLVVVAAITSIALLLHSISAV